MKTKNLDASEKDDLEKHNKVLSCFSKKMEPVLISDANKQKEKEELEEFLAMLDEAIEELKSAKYFPGFREREKLVALSHLSLWDEAKNKEDLRFDTSDKDKLLDEAKWFRLYIGKPDTQDT